MWKEGVMISKVKPLYALDDTISAYLVELSYDKESAGYIVVSASKESYPIIEYGLNCKHFIYKAKDKVIKDDKEKQNKEDRKNYKDKDKFYYLGGYEYGLGLKYDDKDKKEKEDYFDLTSGKPVKKDKAKIKKLVYDYTYQSDQIKVEWEILEITFGSTPPTGQTITDPVDYESGYDDMRTDYCYNMGSTYFTTSDFSGYSSHCGPTAGTNMCLYWTRRDSTFSDLYSSSWD